MPSTKLIFHLKALLAAVTFLFLSGCAVSPTTDKALQQKSLVSLTDWTLEGKLGFRSPQKNGSAWINWRQQGDDYNLRLSGPFGAKATQIQGNNHYAVLRQAGEKDLNAPDAQALTERLFGWPLPVQEMTYWVKGSPGPRDAQILYVEDSKQISTLTQDGWKLEYSDYQTWQHWTLPGKIRGTKGDLSFTLVIKSWALPAP
jgi:outer membrane lipoprotein LolB